MDEFRVIISSPGLSDTGKRLTDSFRVQRADSVQSLKLQIAATLSLRLDCIILIFRGKILLAEWTLGQAVGQVDTSAPLTFHMVVRNFSQDTRSTAWSPQRAESPPADLTTALEPRSPTPAAPVLQPQSADTAPATPATPTTPVTPASAPVSVPPTPTPTSSTLVPLQDPSIPRIVKFSTETSTVIIPSFEMMLIPLLNRANEWALAVSPTAAYRLRGLHPTLNPLPVFSAPPPPPVVHIQPAVQPAVQPIEPEQPMVWTAAAVGTALARFTNLVRANYQILFLLFKIALVVDILATDRALLLEYWPAVTAILLFLLWNTHVLDRALQPLRRRWPRDPLRLPQNLPEETSDYSVVVERLLERHRGRLPHGTTQQELQRLDELVNIDQVLHELTLHQNSSFVLSVRNGFVMLVGSFFPAMHDSWAREHDRRRRLHTDAFNQFRYDQERAAQAAQAAQEAASQAESEQNPSPDAQDPRPNDPDVQPNPLAT